MKGKKNEVQPVRLNYKDMKLQHLKRRVLTISNIMYVVATVMKSHIGLENAISSEDLFKKVYNRPRQPDYVDDFRWDYVRKAMHRLRQTTKLFIANTRKNTDTYVYFVPTTEAEAQKYVDRLENNIKRMRAMQRKAMKSVYEGWFKVDWIEENKTLSALKEVYEKETEQKKYLK